MRQRINKRGLGTTALPLVLIIGALGLSACDHGDKAGAKTKTPATKPSQNASQTVGVAAVTIQSLPRIINASGTVTAWEEVPVGAETGGLTAVAVNVEEGQMVRQGQVLVQLNDSVLRAQLRQQQAAVVSAKATLAQADAALRRARDLQQKGYLSQASLETTTAQQATAAAQVASAQAAEGETTARLAQASIRAPVSGLISKRSVTKGQIVSMGSELFRIVRDGRLELNAEIPETDLALVRAGMPAQITSEQVGTVSGSVRLVNSEVDPVSRLGVARVALSAMGGFRPGMFARAQINASAQPAATVPTEALLYRENNAGVFVVDAQNRAHFRPVQIVARTANSTAATGLAEGERVVVKGAGFLGEGDAVRVAGSAKR
ncbi:MAG: efflux RND transporter periplasmic adaptor subunit [Caulobacter sp.]|nr:efflux RND transporter periplasmic adaptor subunit [Caulobacter sp.]